MADTGGISPIKPTDGSQEATSGGGSLEAALHTPVQTLGQLKQVLIANLGEENGTKAYNAFIQSFAMQMMQQVQQSAAQAQKAAQQMRMGPGV